MRHSRRAGAYRVRPETRGRNGRFEAIIAARLVADDAQSRSRSARRSSAARYVAFQTAAAAICKRLFADVLRMLGELRPPIASTPWSVCVVRFRSSRGEKCGGRSRRSRRGETAKRILGVGPSRQSRIARSPWRKRDGGVDCRGHRPSSGGCRLKWLGIADCARVCGLLPTSGNGRPRSMRRLVLWTIRDRGRARVVRIARGGSVAVPASVTPDLIPAGALAIRQGREGVDGMTVAGLGALDRFALRLGRLS